MGSEVNSFKGYTRSGLLFSIKLYLTEKITFFFVCVFYHVSHQPLFHVAL